MNEINYGHQEIDPKGPPLEWFEGRGFLNVGITEVTISQKLKLMGGGEVGNAFEGWANLINGKLVRFGADGDDFNLASEARDLDDPTERQIAFAFEDLIRIETGFSPVEIKRRIIELFRIYEGHSQAPFGIILLPEREN